MVLDSQESCRDQRSGAKRMAVRRTRFMVETKGYDKDHLLIAVESLTVFYRVQVGIGVVVVLVMALRLFF